ncbi:MAG: glycosyltransferase family 2 protein, partial [Bacteroidales bacterium]
FNWLQPLTDFMEANPQAGICQPKMLSEANPSMFEYAGACGGFIDKYGFPFCRGRILSCVEEDKGQYDTPLKVFWASGACMMIRSQIWRELGGLDESFFAHMEEIDLCWRTQLYGYEVWAAPQSYVFHVGGGTLPNNSPRKLYLNYRNNLLMLHKNLPINGSRNTFIFKRMCIDGLSGIVYILQGKFQYFKAVLRAHKEFKKMRNSTPITLLQPCFKNASNVVSKGIYRKSIIAQFFMGKREFRKL